MTEFASQSEILIKENDGFGEQELLNFLRNYPRVTQVMNAESLVFGKGDQLRFPSFVSSEDEKQNPELGNQGFRRRVAMHSSAVGATMDIILTSLREAGVLELNDTSLKLANEVMALHDLKKLNEILLRSTLGSSDAAYDAAEAHLADLFRRAQFPEEYIQLAGSIGHNGAKDYMTSPHLWPIIRQCAYLADDLLQETVIQVDPLAKVARLKKDPRYEEANAAGFPDRSEYPGFTDSEGNLTPKYDIQEAATTRMLSNVGGRLGIEGRELGKLLIVKASQSGLYKAQFELPPQSFKAPTSL